MKSTKPDTMKPAPKEDPTQLLGFVIHDVARLLRWNFDRRAQVLGLTRSQWQVLANLRHRNGIRQFELAKILEIQPITLGRLIDRLEKAGWVERQDDPTDRRAKTVHLTKKAAPVMDQLSACGRETRKEALVGISEVEQKRLMETLQTLRTNLLNKTQTQEKK